MAELILFNKPSRWSQFTDERRTTPRNPCPMDQETRFLPRRLDYDPKACCC